MKQFDDIIDRLRQHFENVTVHPPADAAALHEVRKRVPGVSDVLLSFWRYCNGICVTRFEEGDLFGIDRSLSLYPLGNDAQRLGRFVPLRGDGCGDYDSLVVGDGPYEGAVVFWDHEVFDGAAYLLGGSFYSHISICGQTTWFTSTCGTAREIQNADLPNLMRSLARHT